MITAMGDVMREAYKRNWITTRDGNCAVRIKDSNIIHMTPSGVRKVLICPEMICRVVLGEELDFQSNMNLNVTGEWEMHYLILKDASHNNSDSPSPPTQHSCCDVCRMGIVRNGKAISRGFQIYSCRT